MNVVKIMKRENIWPEDKVRVRGTSLIRLNGEEVRTVVYTVETKPEYSNHNYRPLESTRVATYRGQTCLHSIVVHTRWVNDE